jgi:hypothetical protein
MEHKISKKGHNLMFFTKDYFDNTTSWICYYLGVVSETCTIHCISYQKEFGEKLAFWLYWMVVQKKPGYSSLLLGPGPQKRPEYYFGSKWFLFKKLGVCNNTPLAVSDGRGGKG